MIGYMKLDYWLIAAALTLPACSPNSDYDATGTFESTEVIVSAEANGRLVGFRLEEGDLLRQGEEIGVIDTVQLYLKKLELESTMKSVDSRRPDIGKQIAATKAQIDAAVRERDRVARLLEANAANRQQLDDWNSRLEVLERERDAQLSSLANSTSSLDGQSSSVAIQIAQVEDQLAKCHIASPIGGTVLAKYTEQGEMTSVGKPLFKVADMEHLFLRAYVTSEQMADVKLGQQVKVMADFGDDTRREYAGKITWIADKAEFTPKTILTADERANQVYAVKIAVENDGFIKLGMYGGVVF